ncbi:MAG: GtrA family protein [Campylobacterota bacterium]|nr:GtrA family protein [Campylobacterota bacterium]
MKQFIFFGIVGTVGFIVDASVLLYLVHIENFGIIFARVISFIVAVFTTWILNRYFTFSKHQKRDTKTKEYLKYLSIQTFGAGVNFLVFFGLIYLFESLKDILIIPLAIASIVAMFFNFFFIKNKIY